MPKPSPWQCIVVCYGRREHETEEKRIEGRVAEAGVREQRLTRLRNAHPLDKETNKPTIPSPSSYFSKLERERILPLAIAMQMQSIKIKKKSICRKTLMHAAALALLVVDY